MKTIHIANTDKQIIVDDVLYPILSMFSWRLTDNGYAVAPFKRRPIRIHRLILGLGHGDLTIVDHINGQKLDNRIQNLRVCTRAQNNQNVGIKSDNRTGYKGVSLHGKRYRAIVRINKKSINIGTFDCPLEAARAYDVAAKGIIGEFAWLNFPQEVA